MQLQDWQTMSVSGCIIGCTWLHVQDYSIIECTCTSSWGTSFYRIPTLGHTHSNISLFTDKITFTIHTTVDSITYIHCMFESEFHSPFTLCLPLQNDSVMIIIKYGHLDNEETFRAPYSATLATNHAMKKPLSVTFLMITPIIITKNGFVLIILCTPQYMYLVAFIENENSCG